MPVTLDQVVAKVEAAKPTSLAQTVHEVIAACGLEVAGNGEVYNPADGAYRSRRTMEVPRDQLFATRRRR